MNWKQLGPCSFRLFDIVSHISTSFGLSVVILCVTSPQHTSSLFRGTPSMNFPDEFE